MYAPPAKVRSLLRINSSESGPHLDFSFQKSMARELGDLAAMAFEQDRVSRDDFTQKDYVSVALMKKAHLSFKAIRVLCEHLLVGDARAVIRSMAETIINGAYISDVGDEAANDYVDFPAYRNWIEYTQLKKVDPKLADKVVGGELKVMKQRYEELEHRFKRRHEWSAENIFQRASHLDLIWGENAGLFRVLVNLIWRPAGAYVHGTAQSVGLQPDMSNSQTLTQQTPSEAARTLYIANLLMLQWFACFGGYLNKNHENELEDLLRRMNFLG